jgi:hypothetical protein
MSEFLISPQTCSAYKFCSSCQTSLTIHFQRPMTQTSKAVSVFKNLSQFALNSKSLLSYTFFQSCLIYFTASSVTLFITRTIYFKLNDQRNSPHKTANKVFASVSLHLPLVALNVLFIVLSSWISKILGLCSSNLYIFSLSIFTKFSAFK